MLVGVFIWVKVGGWVEVCGWGSVQGLGRRWCVMLEMSRGNPGVCGGREGGVIGFVMTAEIRRFKGIGENDALHNKRFEGYSHGELFVAACYEVVDWQVLTFYTRYLVCSPAC